MYIADTWALALCHAYIALKPLPEEK